MQTGGDIPQKHLPEYLHPCCSAELTKMLPPAQAFEIDNFRRDQEGNTAVPERALIGLMCSK